MSQSRVILPRCDKLYIVSSYRRQTLTILTFFFFVYTELKYQQHPHIEEGNGIWHVTETVCRRHYGDYLKYCTLFMKKNENVFLKNI